MVRLPDSLFTAQTEVGRNDYRKADGRPTKRLWSLKSVNVNGNDDEQDSEEVEIEENPLDESELIQDYKIESLQLYDSGKSKFGKRWWPNFMLRLCKYWI